MLCELCASMRRTRALRTDAPDAVAASAGGAVCECCQRSLSVGAASRFVTLVSRLARFGLTGESLLVKKA